MLNLQRIRGSKILGGDYLGVACGNLVEIRDNDPALRALIPAGTNFLPSSTPAFRGRKRLNLSSISSDCLIMMKSGKKKDNVSQPQLYVFINRGIESDQSLLIYTHLLASYRWPNGVLHIKKSSLKKMPVSLTSDLIRLGWKDLRLENGDDAFQYNLGKGIRR